MSIRGIDTQIMVTRTPDYAREASAIQKRPEVTQELLAAAQKLSDAQDQSRVKGSEHSEMETIRTDVDGGSGGAYGEGGEKNRGDEEKDGEIPKGMLVPPGNNVIDIKV